MSRSFDSYFVLSAHAATLPGIRRAPIRYSTLSPSTIQPAFDHNMPPPSLPPGKPHANSFCMANRPLVSWSHPHNLLLMDPHPPYMPRCGLTMSYPTNMRKCEPVHHEMKRAPPTLLSEYARRAC